MTKKANPSVAFALASYMLVLLPLAFAIHSLSHSHTFKRSTADQWQDEEAVQCQLCKDFFHRVHVIASFTFFIIPCTYWKYQPLLQEAAFSMLVNVRRLRGPPVSFSL